METTTSDSYMPCQRLTPIKVDVKLRKEQYLGANQWKITLNGKERLVTIEDVTWYCDTLEDAICSFKMDEIEQFTIKGSGNKRQLY